MKFEVMILDKKVTSIEALYLEKEQQQILLKTIENLVVEKASTNIEQQVEELVFIKYFQHAIQSIRKYKFLSQKNVEIFIENISIISKWEEEEWEKILDIGIYTCMVYASSGKILNYKMKNIEPIMEALIGSDVSVTAYSMYLNVLLTNEIIENIESKKEEYSVSSLIRDLIQDESIYYQDVVIAVPIFNQKFYEYLEKYKKNKKRFVINKWFIETEVNYQVVYQKVLEQMNYINEYLSKPIYSETHFQSLKKLKKFIYWSKEEQELFIKTIQVMDEKISGTLDKVDRILMLIDSFSLNVKENRVINIDFKNKRK